MKGMILAAGFGTRLAPLTDALPKALVPVAGRPMIAHAVETLRRAGCDELVVNAHHFADQIEEYFLRNDFGVPVHVVREREILGTGGGVLHAAPLLAEETEFLLFNADIATEADLASLLRAHRASWGDDRARADDDRAPLATLLVNRRETRRALIVDRQGRLVGKEAWVAEGLTVPPDARRFGFCGVHVVGQGIFQLGAPPGFHDMFDLYRAGLRRGETIRTVVTDAYWTDLGAPDRIAAHEAR